MRIPLVAELVAWTAMKGGTLRHYMVNNFGITLPDCFIWSLEWTSPTTDSSLEQSFLHFWKMKQFLSYLNFVLDKSLPTKFLGSLQLWDFIQISASDDIFSLLRTLNKFWPIVWKVIVVNLHKFTYSFKICPVGLSRVSRPSGYAMTVLTCLHRLTR